MSTNPDNASKLREPSEVTLDLATIAQRADRVRKKFDLPKCWTARAISEMSVMLAKASVGGARVENMDGYLWVSLKNLACTDLRRILLESKHHPRIAYHQRQERSEPEYHADERALLYDAMASLDMIDQELLRYRTDDLSYLHIALILRHDDVQACQNEEELERLLGSLRQRYHRAKKALAKLATSGARALG